MLHSSTNGMYICFWCPNPFPKHFLCNTNASCNSFRLAPQFTARPSAPLLGKRPPGGGKSRHLLEMWAAHKSAPQNATPVTLLARNHLHKWIVRCKERKPRVSHNFWAQGQWGVTLPTELDTGAFVSLISERVWNEILPGSELVKCATLLKIYTGERLHVLGQLQVRVEYSDQEKCLPLLVVAGNGPSLWGRNWLNEIRLDWVYQADSNQITVTAVEVCWVVSRRVGNSKRSQGKAT